MSVTAKKLSRSGARGKDLDVVVREQLGIIDDKLLHADRTWGRNVVTYDLPTSFNLPGLATTDGQRIVYSAILRSLEKRGFEVRIILEAQQTTICIAWMTDLEAGEVNAMNALIKAKRIAREDLDTFIQRGAIPAPQAASAVRQGWAPAPAPLKVTAKGQKMEPREGVSIAPPAAARQTTPAALSEDETALLNVGG